MDSYLSGDELEDSSCTDSSDFTYSSSDSSDTSTKNDSKKLYMVLLSAILVIGILYPK